MTDLLKPTASVEVHGHSRFVVEDFDSDAELCPLCRPFKEHFQGKVEENVAACALTASLLLEDSKDSPILAELGDRGECSLAHVFELLFRQPNGEDGFLLTDGHLNCSYLRDAGGTLTPVAIRWDDVERSWEVRTCSVDSRFGWTAGSHVLSRGAMTNPDTAGSRTRNAATAPDLLEQVAVLQVPAVTRFVAGEASWFRHVFKRQFVGKVEENVAASTLTVSRLLRDSPGTLLLELDERAEIALAHLYELLSRQPHGEPGVLATDGCVTSFYVRDAAGRLRHVIAVWNGYDSDWLVDTAGLKCLMHGQRAGDRVVCR